MSSPRPAEPVPGAFVPRRLVVIGAAAGMGQWLTHHVFSQVEWDDAFFIDTEESASLLASRDWRLGCPATLGYLDAVDGSLRRLGDSARISVDTDGLVVCLAVPRTALPQVVRNLVTAGGEASLVVVAPNMGQALAAVDDHVPGRPVVAIHPLFDSSARSLEGHTVYLARSGEPAYGWLVDAVQRAGGFVKLGTAEGHDAAMSSVQAAAHQALLVFADAVTRSGLDLQEDLWAARTPLFESLFGLATRVLDQRQEPTVIDIQSALGGREVAQRTRDSLDAFTAALEDGGLGTFIEEVRQRFSGTLFETVRDTASVAVNAAQSKRTELAHRRRTGELVGLRSRGGADSLRVGRIVEVGPTEVSFLELLVGERGRAVLLEGSGAPNARKLGINRRPRQTSFGLGHVDVVIGEELERELDRSLAFLHRDVRFLVPESVAGSGVLSVVAPTRGIRDCAVVSEVVRTGQRSVVVRLSVRADYDVEEMVELLRERVQAAYAWSPGISRPAAPGTLQVNYLGPAGTFSEDAARQSVLAVGIGKAEFCARASFDEVLAAVGPTSLAVLPLTSSSSGLVSRSVTALLGCGNELVAGGVADVAVRFDAYITVGHRLEELRGQHVYSHPQALAQCSAFIRRWGLEAVPTPSTSEAIAMLSGGTVSGVAIAGSGRALSHPELKVAEREVDDLSGSVTRFLIVGAPDSFREFVGGSDPTLRSVTIGRAGGLPLLGAGKASYEEVLVDDVGQFLWVTSTEPGAVAGPDCRYLGRVPWSPRTPVVRVGSDA
ncbi:MAG: chorismate mutase / prephenate dehydratase [Frankiales bacterium]|nr:chorismate mutase / prephenate dehydratase [Frankiales bacterium]